MKEYYDGESWATEDPLALTVRAYPIVPTDTVLASGSIAPGSVSTSAGWITINLSTPVVLRPNTIYAVVVYTIGGDASNYFAIHNSGNIAAYGNRFEYFLSSNNSGGSWTLDDTKDLSLIITGVQYVKLYSGTISNNIITPLGKVLAALIIKAQASGSMEFAGFDDHTLAAPVVTKTNATQELITVLKPDDPRLHDAPPSDTLTFNSLSRDHFIAVGARVVREKE